MRDNDFDDDEDENDEMSLYICINIIVQCALRIGSPRKILTNLLGRSSQLVETFYFTQELHLKNYY